jgi:outer membrane protein OmpA-like peptidoglycan-associated protein
MRQFCVVLAALFGTAMPAQAQVTVDLHALDALPGAKPAGKEHAVQHPALKSAQRRAATTTSAKPTPEPATEAPAATQKVATASPAPTAAPPATATPPPATLPTAPPPTAALAPVTTAPQVAQVGPPPPPPISDSAASAATSTGSGLRVTFGAGDANLSPASAAAIKNVVGSAPSGGNTSFNVVAYAAGTPEDPSTARRLSLSRALAVRSALVADGVDSSRIYVRALGAAGGAEAPDRVDLAVMGGNAPAADAGAKSQSP